MEQGKVTYPVIPLVVLGLRSRSSGLCATTSDVTSTSPEGGQRECRSLQLLREMTYRFLLSDRRRTSDQPPDHFCRCAKQRTEAGP